MTGTELDGMLLTIIGLFCRKLHDRKRQFHNMAQQAAQFMNEHFHENIAMDRLSEDLKCSKGHFFRKFKEFTGETPVGYLNTIRIKQAAFYLKNTKFQINHIAKLCGFEDPYYFSRTFHRIIGQSPKQYRDTQ
jgi:AraC-like DNA-binding protein